MKKLTHEEFDLQRVKTNSKKGLDISFWGKGNNNDLFKVESDNAPHPDLTNKLAEFKELFAISMETVDGWILARENTRKNDEALKEAIQGYNDEINKYHVSGVILVGKEDSLGIRVTGYRKTESGSVGMASPAIRFTDAETNINKKAVDLFDEIQREVWAYVFMNKKAQLDIFAEKENESGLNNLNLKAV